MNILLNGIGGHMGREVAALCESGYRSARLVCGVDLNPCEEKSVTVYRERCTPVSL